MKAASFFGIIPARYKSSRFPGKMLHLIKGKPLVQWTYENALNTGLFEKIIIAADSKEIANACHSFGAETLMTDPSHPNGTSRIIEVANNLELQDQSILVNLQGDEPFVHKNTLMALKKVLEENPDCPMATSAYPLQDIEKAQHPSCVKCLVDKKGYALYFSRSLVPYSKTPSSVPYLGHLGIYAFRWSFLKNYPLLKDTPLYLQEDLEQLKVLEHGYPIKVVMANAEEGLGVNEKEDLPAMEAYICKQNLS